MADKQILSDKKQKKADENKHGLFQRPELTSQNLMTWDISSYLVETPLEGHTDLLSKASPEQKIIIARQLQQTYGNRYVQRVIESIKAQTKLTVSQPGDTSEQEADRVADMVTSQVKRQQDEEEPETVQPKIFKLQRQSTENPEDEEIQTKALLRQRDDLEDEEIQPKASEVRRAEPEEEEELQAKGSSGEVKVADQIENQISSSRGLGRPLTDSTRKTFEPQFGSDFSEVKVHTDAEADNLSQQLGAEAFTTGQDIFFREGRYQPDSDDGKKLIAHELVHVLQQRAAALTQPQTTYSNRYVHGRLQRGREKAEEVTGDNARLKEDRDIGLHSSQETIAKTGLDPDVFVQRNRKKAGSAKEAKFTAPTKEDYEGYIQDVIRFFKLIKEEYGKPPKTGAKKFPRTLAGLKSAYDNAINVVDREFPDDEAKKEQLRSNYQAALKTLRRTVGPKNRVNFVVITMAPEFDNGFIESARSYAEQYMGGDNTIRIEDVASPQELFDGIERNHPEMMIGRVDIFAHGGPYRLREEGGKTHVFHSIFMGDAQYLVKDFEDEVNAREWTGGYIESISRFDAKSRIEIQACRQAATWTPKKGKGESEEEYLTRLGKSLGGEQGQEVQGYKERIAFPVRMITIEGQTVSNTATDLYGTNPLAARQGHPERASYFVRQFENRAVKTFNRVAAGSEEIKKYLTQDEQEMGVSERVKMIGRKRKIQIMRTMYDEGKGWQFKVLRSTRRDPQRQPHWKMIKRPQYTYTAEKRDWARKTLKVRVSPSK